ncbi:DegT/DnrJ/EryC1/StrS family aminotransferase [Croceimicrobium hydrocarbonivorans]|uniref:GDP-perosamine synthase n=1 Tax=Croceimicrobium hydrocarbonivorans TaxID=2761580 RepID=A0A7H0VG91_9FLAO|nr:DegT/DnrJ/EryC1/StrS family aminotransferase [Croceimicrobium hydrocarbonivorans]QNR24739.1 DegT/DnrJ/EryC1/StrS family aminotransferase [Croceimicrobium hydrocarbonivorans]
MSDKTKIWLSSPHMGGKEQEFVNEAFETNWIAPLGPHVNGFEADLEKYNGVAHAAALSSGTAALHIALDILNVGPSDIVIVQSFTFCGSANPVIYRGAEPVFIDSEEETWNMCPIALNNALEDLSQKGLIAKVKAIIPVHLYGMPAKMDEIKAVASSYNIPILEDAAESLGSTYKGTFTGAIGDMGVYSFNGNKIITTSGGGALVSSNKEWIDKARFLATQARDDAPHYQHTQIGYNYRLSNVLAGIGRGQMLILDQHIEARRKNFERYQNLFSRINQKGYAVKLQPGLENSFSNRWLSSIIMDPAENKGKDREGLRNFLQEENIEARPLWKPMHMQPVFQNAKYYGGDVAAKLFEIGLCLPSGSNLSEDDWARIETKIESFFS